MSDKNQDKLKLCGFNNLSKSLNFNLYYFGYTPSDESKLNFIHALNSKFSAQRLSQLLKSVTQEIDAEILNISIQDYEPHGASATLLIAEEAVNSPLQEYNHQVEGQQLVLGHLDKSHIAAHTYPDSNPTGNISSFRVDLDISTCGVVIPSQAADIVIKDFDWNVIHMDYCVRGFTRDESGQRIYCDHDLKTISQAIIEDNKENYFINEVHSKSRHRLSTSMRKINITPYDHTEIGGSSPLTTSQYKDIEEKLKNEMSAVFSMQ